MTRDLILISTFLFFSSLFSFFFSFFVRSYQLISLSLPPPRGFPKILLLSIFFSFFLLFFSSLLTALFNPATSCRSTATRATPDEFADIEGSSAAVAGETPHEAVATFYHFLVVHSSYSVVLGICILLILSSFQWHPICSVKVIEFLARILVKPNLSGQMTIFHGELTLDWCPRFVIFDLRYNLNMLGERCAIEFGTVESSLGILYEARLRGVLGSPKLEITNQIHFETCFDT